MAGTKPRDKQKQRLYDAQYQCQFWRNEGEFTIRQSQAFVDKVMKQKYTRTIFDEYRFPFSPYPEKIIVESNSGNHATRRIRNLRTVNLIRLNYLGRHKWTILHEIAHQITWGHESHGPEFVDVLAKLIKRHIGKQAHDDFLNACAEKKVRVMGKSGKARVPRKRKIS